MSKKLLIHSLSILLLTSCAPQIDAMIRDGSDDIDVVRQSCSICYDSKTKDQFVSLSCGHSTCKECLQRTIDIAIKDQSTKNIRCFSCWTHLITQEEIAKIVTPEQQEKLGAIQLKEWLAKQSLAKYCPTPDCNFAFINESTCQSTLDCPQCKKEYCSACLIKHPEYLSCQAAQEHYATADEKANQAWKNEHSKPCPQCNASIEKNSGCDHMTCSKCRYEFCWKCLGMYYHHGVLIHITCNQPNTPARHTNDATIQNIVVRADMPRDFVGFGQMLHEAGITAIINLDGTIIITARMRWDAFNRILDQANALYR